MHQLSKENEGVDMTVTQLWEIEVTSDGNYRITFYHSNGSWVVKLSKEAFAQLGDAIYYEIHGHFPV